jgi:nucleotide-binding universal stress UspA family protein
MQNYKKILLASHGTVGGKAAEQQAASLASGHEGASVHQLVVVPDLWQGMTGDDWLNNGLTRDRFTNYLEDTLEQEVREHVEVTQSLMQEQGIPYSVEVEVGKPEEVLIAVAEKGNYDAVVMGSPRPKGVKGLRSRMKLDKLVGSLKQALIIVPYPND